MTVVGRRLRREREKRGLRIVDVAMTTKVGAHHLSALEYGDFDALPDDRRVIGLVRVYAEHLGLDANDVAAELSRELAAARPAGAAGSGRDKALAAAAPPAGRPGLGVRRVGATAAGVVLVLAIAVWWWVAGGAVDEAPVAAIPPGAGAAETMPWTQAPPDPEVAAIPVEAAPVRAEAAAAPALEDDAGRLTIPEYGVGTAVVDRRLVGEADRFAEGQRVWFWTRVDGGAAGETVRHVWIREGREMASIALTLGGPHWRTQSRKTLPHGSAGRWAVEARDEAGRVLARSEFLCSPRP